MKNVTITLEEEVARWARVRAAEKNTSMSRLIGELLREHMKQEESYEAAMRRFLSRKPKPLKPRGRTYPSREELHDRARLR
jgi:plasmid stability protein